MSSPGNIHLYLQEPHPAQQKLLSILSRIPAPVIFDIGSCEGEDTIRYQKLFPKAEIHLFEPLPENLELIKTNLELYGINNVLVNSVAMSNNTGTASFHVSSGKPDDLFAGEDWNYGNKSSSLLPPSSPEPMHGWIQFEESLTIPCQRLDDYCHEAKVQNIDLIHIDVQGAEGLVLDGGSSMLPHVSCIWIEVMNQPLYQSQLVSHEVDQKLQSYGFRCIQIDSRGLEEDRLYLNLNHSHCWTTYLITTLKQLITRLRIGLGRIRQNILND